MKLTKMHRKGDTKRWFLWFGDEWDNGLHLTLETCWGGKFTMAGFKFGGEGSDLKVYLGLYFFTFWLGIANLFSWDYKRKVRGWAKEKAEALKTYAYTLDPFEGRDTSIRIHHGSVWLSFWDSLDGWSHDDNKKWPWNGGGWTYTLELEDWILGRRGYEEEEAAVCSWEVGLPEGMYPATVELYRCRWPRNGGLLFFIPMGRKWQYRATVKVEDGIPIPGKGENSWDCEDDAIYSSTGAVSDTPITALQACMQFAVTVSERRLRYASENWEPEDGWPDHCERW